ncbi:hypothetical protein MUK42_14437 [Musa troglodytarum]|uniref:Uncharacterized protein n=1 Tax=Musa troglodytarum TaxID=320322 RepID=A0A9E7KM27_9LILI|nr:hypothetical protein MUK42_14437 [Musa troglodytarum]
MGLTSSLSLARGGPHAYWMMSFDAHDQVVADGFQGKKRISCDGFMQTVEGIAGFPRPSNHVKDLFYLHAHVSSESLWRIFQEERKASKSIERVHNKERIVGGIPRNSARYKNWIQ